MKRHFQHFQALLGAARALQNGVVSRRALPIVAGGLIGAAALLSAQTTEPDQTDTRPTAAATPAPAADVPPPVVLESQPVVPSTPVSNAPAPAPSAASSPALRASDVTFPTPASRAGNEPLVAIGRPATRTDYGEDGNRRATQLRSMPPERFTFDRALLRDVLRFLGEAAGIPFVSIPENAPQAQQLVTFRLTASPFAALESVARQNEIKLVYEDGVWFMRVGGTSSYAGVRELENANELVGVIYQLRHDPADRVDFQTQLTGPQQQQQVGQSGSGMAGGVGGMNVNVTTPNLPLQNSQKVFVQRAPKLVNDVRAILGLKPLVYRDDGTVEDPDITGGTDIPSQAQTALGGAQQGAAAAQAGPGQTSMARDAAASIAGLMADESRRSLGISPVYVPASRPQVIYNSDSNFLWVVATRKQHKWVAEYLTKVDNPQTLIAIEVKFLETKKNPQTDIGINWQNTFGTGLTITGGASIGGTNIGSLGFTNGFANTSINSVMSNTTTDARLVSGQVPYSAVLTLNQFSATLQAFMQDRDTSIVQYPRVLTLNNKEVAITSAENTPLNVGTSTSVSSTGTSGTTVGQLGYLPTGTQINILPKVVNSSQIAMTVAITVSSVVGELPINLGTGVNLYPVTSERVYNASLQVGSGYTLAVGGLEKVDDSNFEGGIPVLKDIPGLGYLFKNKNKKRNKVNLIIFITPYLIGDPATTPGISETPQSVVPLRPGVPPQAPSFTPDGQLAGGAKGVEDAFAWLDFQLRYYRQINLESMMTMDSIRKLRDVIGVARALLAYLQLQAGQPPYDPETSTGRNALRAEDMVTDLNRALANAQENMM